MQGVTGKERGVNEKIQLCFALCGAVSVMMLYSAIGAASVVAASPEKIARAAGEAVSPACRSDLAVKGEDEGSVYGKGGRYFMERDVYAEVKKQDAKDSQTDKQDDERRPLSAPATGEEQGGDIMVQPRKDSTAGGLNVTHSHLPGSTLAYLSCEAVVFGEPAQSTPLFQVQVSDDSQGEGVHWKKNGDQYAYTWRYENGIEVEFRATPNGSGLRLYYKLTNTSDTLMKRVILHTCIPTTEAPAFFSDLKESTVHEPGKTGNYMGFYDRTFLWSGERRFSVGQTQKGKEEIHLSFTRGDQPPVEWGWWVNGPESFDVPLIAVQSKDGAFTTALGFEAAEWASCNGGDDRACFHLFPLFGDLQPGESREVRGCFYLMPGTPEDALNLFRTDFPER